MAGNFQPDWNIYHFWISPTSKPPPTRNLWGKHKKFKYWV